MSYQCQDCSYRSHYFKGGICPGCGSRHIRNLTTASKPAARARKPYMLTLACALWLYLVVEVCRILIA